MSRAVLPKKKGMVVSKVIGAALLVVGLALIGYGFYAPDSVSSGVSHTFTGAPAEKALCLLLGGSAAVVVGEAMIFHLSSKN